MKTIRLTLVTLVWLLAACGGTPPTDLSPPTSTTQPTVTLTPPHAPSATSTPTAIPTPFAVPAEVTAWLMANAIPFDSPLPGHGCDDLRPLLDMVGDARIVALGEATHGTREFFTMKHRILECLVQEKGFNIFAIEANAPEANRVNAYVQTGRGNAKSALAGMYFWTWNTHEVLDMIEWMHTHNQNPGNAPQVSFRGFDMQFGFVALWDVLNYLQRVDPNIMGQVESDLQCLGLPHGDMNYVNLDAETQNRCRQNVEAIHELLLAQEDVYRAATSTTAYAEAVEAARILVQHEQFLRLNRQDISVDLFNLRDRAMADNIAWLLEQGGPEAKIVLWAHNAHIQTLPLSPPNPDLEGTFRNSDAIALTMGNNLRAHFGADMVVIGFSFESGRFRAISGSRETGYSGLRSIPVQPPLPNSHEEYLYPEGLNHYYLDLRTIPSEGPIAEWFQESRWLRTIGSEYDRNDLTTTSQRMRLQEAFDILIGLRNTTPAEGIEFEY